MPIAYIVDDQQELANATRLLFKLLHYDAILFAHPRDLARHMLAALALPDLLVVDMSMPEVNGMDVVKWIRRSKRFRAIPILILSAETHPELVKDALKAGANAYLFKPVTLEELEEALRHIFHPLDPQPESLTATSARP
jgi:DNA-binding response OmpR family regulator